MSMSPQEYKDIKENGFTSNIDKLLKLHQEHPDLPIIPMVSEDVVVNDDYGYWMGEWGKCEVTKIYVGREGVHFYDDDEEDVLNDMNGCKYGCDERGRDLYALDEGEWKEIFVSLPWKECIVVYITS